MVCYPANAQVPANIDSAMIACYPFNGNAQDVTGNGNHGTVNGANLVSDRFGNPNAAYSFNGSSQNILVPAFNTKITSNEFSIAFWSTSTMYATRSPFLLVSDDPSNRLNIHIYYGNTLSNSQTFFDFGSIYNTGRLYIASSPLPSPTTWDHWVFTNSAISGTMKCYKNGVLMLSKTGNGNFSSATANKDLLIGGGLGVNSAYLWFNGSLDDIRIYGRELNTADINALYNLSVKCLDGILTGVKGNPISLTYGVYPNPTNSSFKINGLGDDGSKITVTSIQGSLIKRLDNATNEAEIDLSGFAPGVYVLTIENAKGLYNQKIIKN